MKYKVSTYDPNKNSDDEFSWRCRASNCNRWTLRKVLRRLEGEGYDRACSILVERTDPEPMEDLTDEEFEQIGSQSQAMLTGRRRELF